MGERGTRQKETACRDSGICLVSIELKMCCLGLLLDGEGHESK